MAVDASNKVFRAQGIPPLWDDKDLANFLLDKLYPKLQSQRLKWQRSKIERGPTVHSLAPGLDGFATATVTFNPVPEGSKEGSNLEKSWVTKLDGRKFTITLDTQFLGLTPLSTPPSSCHLFDIVAISGLGGHAFGSFKQRKGDFMWLRDRLPLDIEDGNNTVTRVITYGYQSNVAESASFQTLEDLAISFKNALQLLVANDTRTHPILFIAHSLGGLILKKTLILLANSTDPFDRRLWDRVHGIAFFGVPNRGMPIESLMDMVGQGPNREFIKSIDHTDSRSLEAQLEDFPRISQDLDIFSFYETSMSPTAKQSGGKWTMSGPSVPFVSKKSATGCVPPGKDGTQNICPIPRNHSDMVKFAPNDNDYLIVCRQLKIMAANASKAYRTSTDGSARSKKLGGLAINMEAEDPESVSSAQSVETLATNKPHLSQCSDEAGAFERGSSGGSLDGTSHPGHEEADQAMTPEQIGTKGEPGRMERLEKGEEIETKEQDRDSQTLGEVESTDENKDGKAASVEADPRQTTGLSTPPHQEKDGAAQLLRERTMSENLLSMAQRYKSTVFVVPILRNKDFVKRYCMAKLETEISRVGVTGAPCVLTGAAGLGKTQIALELAYRRRQQDTSTSILWVDATNMESMRESYARVAVAWRIPGYQDPDADYLELVSRWLRDENSGPWLMIIDNIHGLKLVSGSRQYFPKCEHGARLFVTRHLSAIRRLDPQSWHTRSAHIRVGPPSFKCFSSLLGRQLKGSGVTASKEQVDKLYSVLDGNPLGITQVGAFIRDTGCTIDACIDSLEAGSDRALTVLSHEFEPHGRGPNAPGTMLQLLQDLFNYLSKLPQNLSKFPQSLSLRCWIIMAHYHFDDIPLQLVFHAASSWPNPPPKEKTDMSSHSRGAMSFLRSNRICLSQEESLESEIPHADDIIKAKSVRMPRLVHMVTRKLFLPKMESAAYSYHRALNALYECFRSHPDFCLDLQSIIAEGPLKPKPWTYKPPGPDKIGDHARRMKRHWSAAIEVNQNFDFDWTMQHGVTLEAITWTKCLLLRQVAYATFHDRGHKDADGSIYGDDILKCKEAKRHLMLAHDTAKNFLGSGGRGMQLECLAEWRRLQRYHDRHVTDEPGLKVITSAEKEFGPNSPTTIVTMLCFAGGIPRRWGDRWDDSLLKKKHWLEKCLQRDDARSSPYKDHLSLKIMRDYGIVLLYLSMTVDAIRTLIPTIDLASAIFGVREFDYEERHYVKPCIATLEWAVSAKNVNNDHVREQDRYLVNTYLFRRYERHLGGDSRSALRYEMRAAISAYECGMRGDAMADMERVASRIQQLFGGGGGGEKALRLREEFVDKARDDLAHYQGRVKGRKRLLFANVGNSKEGAANLAEARSRLESYTKELPKFRPLGYQDDRPIGDTDKVSTPGYEDMSKFSGFRVTRDEKS